MDRKINTSFRLNARLLDRLRVLCGVGPYPPTQTAVVERGIELAIAEWEKKEGKQVKEKS